MHIKCSSLQAMMKGVISHTVAAVHLFLQNDSSRLYTCVQSFTRTKSATLVQQNFSFQK